MISRRCAWFAGVEVKDIGSLNSTTRTPEQSHIAVFWQSNPAPNYNAVARRFAEQLSLGVTDSAVLFAMVDLTAADAIINCWNDKYYWNFWHFRNADVQAANPGRETERWIHKHYFASVH